MKIIGRAIATLLVLGFANSALAQQECSAITCDCKMLPTESWRKACADQEARLIAGCVKNSTELSSGYCSIHGPLANRVPLELDVEPDAIQLISSEEISKLNNTVAVLYWAIIKDFDSFEVQLKQNDFAEATRKLDVIEHNVDKLFDVQLQVTASLESEKKQPLAQLAWRDYSADTLSFGSDFFIRSESMLNAYDHITEEADRENTRDIALRLMTLSGKVYEQVGFAYGKGMRHKHAAKAWKNAADASVIIMAHQTESLMADKKPGFYRFQSAARLHRASYHWVIGSGRGSAEESLAESQKFMDDGSSISRIVDEERQIKTNSPYWK